MAAGAFQIYGLAKEAMLENVIGPLDNSGTPRFRITLHTSSYTPSLNTHSLWSDVSATEVTGTGYTASGIELVPTVAHAAGTVTFDATDVSWTSSTITAKYAVITQDTNGTGAPLVAGDLLLCYVDLESGGGDVSTTNGTFAINFHANGIFTLA